MSIRVTRQAEKPRGSHVWWWGPLVGYCVLIFLVSARNDLAPPAFPSSDKVAHILEYGVLGILWVRMAQAIWPHWTFLQVLVSTSLFTGLYGVTDEWHQFYVPGRFADWHDVLADLCGGTLGGIGYLIGGQVLRWRTMEEPTSMDQSRGLQHLP